MKSISKILLLVLLFGVNAKGTFSQTQIPSSIADLVKISDNPNPDSLASFFRLDFAVPNDPAFQILGTSPSNILRPSSAKEFGTSFSSFINGSGGLSIPRSFSLEFSPGLLIGGNGLSLRKYQKNPWLYRLRLSAGTKRLEGESGPTQIAFGFRTSFIDKSDMRMDEELLKKMTAKTTQILSIISDSVAAPPPGGEGAGVVVPSNAQKMQIEAISAQLKQIITQAQVDTLWNKDALDIAGAVLLGSQDSLGKNLQVVEYAGWLTYAKGINKWGQWLLGFKAGTARDSIGVSPDSLGDFSFSGSVSTRLYVGINNYKAFAEVQWEKKSGVKTLLFNGGGEARLSNGMWFSFSGGVERDLDLKEWNIVSKLTVNLGLPFL